MFESLLSLSLGALVITKEKAEQLADEMVNRGEIHKEETREAIARLMEKGREAREQLRAIVKEETEKICPKNRFVLKEEIARLEDRIKELESILKSQQQQ